MMSRPFKNIPDGCQADFDAQFLKLSVEMFIAPNEVVGSKLKDEVHRRLWRSWAARLSALRILHIQPAAIRPRLNDKHYVGDVVLKQGSNPHQVGSLLFGWNNLGIIDAISQHLDLIRQQLEPGIVSRHKKPREKNENHMKHTRKTTHLRLPPVARIPLALNELRGDLRFRTPRKCKEFKNLPKLGVSCYPKAGICRQKWTGFLMVQLGFSRGVGSPRISGVAGRITNFYAKKFALPSDSVPIGVRNKLSLFALP
jgi:hypothetical protein